MLWKNTDEHACACEHVWKNTDEVMGGKMAELGAQGTTAAWGGKVRGVC